MKSFKFIVALLSFIPFALFAKPTVSEVVKQFEDKSMTEAYENFQKNPSRGTMDDFLASMHMIIFQSKSGAADANLSAKVANLMSISDYLMNTRTEELVRIKATKFNFPKQAEKKTWNLSVNIRPANGLSFINIPVPSGDFSESYFQMGRGDVALNQKFENDYISVRYAVYTEAEMSPSFKSGKASEHNESKYFEVSRYELMAKSMDTGECEIEFADKNLEASLSFKFYNMPCVYLMQKP